MRTTLDIADDVLFAAKEIAQREKKSIGQVMSDLARKAFAHTGRYDTAIAATLESIEAGPSGFTRGRPASLPPSLA